MADSEREAHRKLGLLCAVCVPGTLVSASGTRYKALEQEAQESRVPWGAFRTCYVKTSNIPSLNTLIIRS